MKNIVLVFLFEIALVGLVNAQSKTEIGVYYNPSFTGRIIKSNGDLNWLKNEWNNLESRSFGNSFGAFAERSFTEKVSLKAGMGFTTYGEKIDSLNEYGIDKYKIAYRFLELPLVASYYVGDNLSARPYFSFGYALNYFLNKSITYSLDGSPRDFKNIFKSEESAIHHSLRLSFGYDFKLDNKWHLKAELIASQFFNSLTQGGVERFPNSIGISMQIRKN